MAAGATAQGADVLRVGLCSTDMLYYVAGALDVAGVMLTASHNPARYNGIKLCRAGAVPVGRTNTPAFSYRWFTGNQLHGATRNPHDATLTPGGSSGGSAAAVAAGLRP